MKTLAYPPYRDVLASITAYDCCNQRERDGFIDWCGKDATNPKYITNQCVYFISPQTMGANSFGAQDAFASAVDAQVWWDFQLYMHAWSFVSHAFCSKAQRVQSRPKIMLGHALIFYTPAPRQRKTWEEVQKILANLRAFGVDVMWKHEIGEQHMMFQEKKGIRKSSVFSKGLLNMLRAGDRARVLATKAILGKVVPYEQLNGLGEVEAIAEEMIYQMNCYSDLETYDGGWRAFMRDDLAELYSELTKK